MTRYPQKVQISTPRRSKMHIGATGINLVRKTRPWVATWWSVALPGVGHIYLGLYVKGLILMAGEIVFNVLGRINLVILYTFTGQWQKVHEVINYEMALPYCVIFVFAICDSYRVAVEVNKYSWLEEKQPIRDLAYSKVTQMALNFLDKREPWVASMWSAFFVGLGHLYCHRIITGFILMGWYLAVIVKTHLAQLMICTVLGNFDRIPYLVNYEWLLFFPSIHLFSMYDSYNHAITYNQLFKEEQMYYLKQKYGGSDWKSKLAESKT